ncbi:hypothetical protein ATI61_105705 [Archangium gephyra]|uniref:Uncharacterized protein n=1 Tax=Archangium gephyra TaxID=48 RepID=A0AAC8QEM1_9BACT|nr:hypothetical protein [Archangium gephyra]AKJ06307.1 Hypothetical protein AA314_07933 [Archangium gephyra]REG32377.1 hypothetical protein ATI61_105705 [Archangium gephyra]
MGLFSTLTTAPRNPALNAGASIANTHLQAGQLAAAALGKPSPTSGPSKPLEQLNGALGQANNAVGLADTFSQGVNTVSHMAQGKPVTGMVPTAFSKAAGRFNLVANATNTLNSALNLRDTFQNPQSTPGQKAHSAASFVAAAASAVPNPVTSLVGTVASLGLEHIKP